MLSRSFLATITLTIVAFHVQKAAGDTTTRRKGLSFAIVEHEPKKFDPNVLNDPAVQAAAEKPLIRVHHIDADVKNSTEDSRNRRQLIETIQSAGFIISIVKALTNTESGEQIKEIAKQVAIAILVTISLCLLCCCAITVTICVKCCCRGGKHRKTAKGTVLTAQTAYIPGNLGEYPPKYDQKMAPQSWNPGMYSSPEGQPMLPSAWAPPLPDAQHHMGAQYSQHEKLYPKV